MKRVFFTVAGLLLLLISCSPIKPNTPGATGPGHLGTWITTSSMIGFPRDNPVAANGWLYAIGAIDNNIITPSRIRYSPYPFYSLPLGAVPTTQTTLLFTMLTTVQAAPINPDGSLGTWITETSLPLTDTTTASPYGDLYDPVRTTTSNSYLYAFFTQATWYSPINPDGSLGQWQQTIPLPKLMPFTVTYCSGFFTITSLYDPLITEYNGFIYALFTQSTWFTRLNPNGSLSPWQAGVSFTSPVIGATSFATDNYLYLIGQVLDNTYSPIAVSGYKIYKAAINPDGSLGVWTFEGEWKLFELPEVIIPYNDWIYAYQWPSLSIINEVQRIPINQDGSLGKALVDTSTLFASPFAGVAYNGYLYAFGGYPVTQTSHGDYYAIGNDFTTTIEYTTISP
ncbi:MAG: hypothetical protein M1491_09845 [Deltaproteobacteria bacterium]|nr:hypothetical protein [Deltaproteobacteria bacterium]